MNDYTGKICPYCKTELKPHDNIVVCSECDMPHHKDCWVENQGCTTFGCMGTIKAADNTESSVTTTQMNYENSHLSNQSANTGVVYCTRCGSKNSSSSSFCSNCGNRLAIISQESTQSYAYTQANANNSNPYVNQQSNPYQQNNYQANGYSTYQALNIDTDLQRLVGTKTEYYIPKFQMMKSNGKSTSWNWPAFLVTPYWMIYRRMYGYGIAILAVDIIINLLDSPVLYLLLLGGYIAFGILGNYIYMRYLENKVSQAKVMNEPYKSLFISSNCGVNTIATVLAIIFARVVLIAIYLR